MFAKLSAEFIGTFWLVLGGCGSAVLAAAFPEVGIGFVGVALALPRARQGSIWPAVWHPMVTGSILPAGIRWCRGS